MPGPHFLAMSWTKALNPSQSDVLICEGTVTSPLQGTQNNLAFKRLKYSRPLLASSLPISWPVSGPLAARAH